MRTKLASWLRAGRPTSEGTLEGQGLVEYALLLVLVAIACIASVVLLGGEVRDLWSNIQDVVVTTLGGG